MIWGVSLFELGTGTVVALVLGVLGVIIIMRSVQAVPQGTEHTVERFGRYTRTFMRSIILSQPSTLRHYNTLLQRQTKNWC